MASHTSQVLAWSSALQAAAPQPIRHRSRRRHHEAVERETLITLPILSNQLDGPERERSPAEFRVNGILDVAPEVPVDENPARISAGEEPDVSGTLNNQRQLTGVDAPELEHAVVGEPVRVDRQSVASWPRESDVRGAARLPVVARTSGAYQRN